MRLFKASLLLLSAALGIAGCSPIYIPNAPPTILPRQAGDLHVAAAVGTHGLDASVGYATSENTVIAAAGSYKGGGEEFEYLRHGYGELLAGWYSPLGSGSVALFLGAGTGNAQASCTDFGGFSEISCDNLARSGGFMRYILQGTVGVSRGRKSAPTFGPDVVTSGQVGRPFSYIHEVGLATRIVVLSFDRLVERRYTLDPQTRTPIAGEPSEHAVTALLLEPTLFTRWRSGTFGMEAQVGGTIPLVNRSKVPVQYIHLSFGILLRFGE